MPFSWMFWMFGLFIVSCGFTHLLEVVTFHEPLYRLSGLVKALTALASWATVLCLVPLVPRALALRSPEELQREIAARTAELAAANAALHEEAAAREQALAEAEAANRAKDEFLATVSHELRTPLNAMLGWVHLLKSGKLDAATAARGVEVLERNTRAQAQLIDDVLDVSRIVAGKLRLEPRLVELPGVIEQAVDTVRPAAQARDIALEVNLDPAGGPVSGDPTRLQQVVWNLLSNAVKFTPRGGRVQVSLRREGRDAVLRVRDNGEGILPDFLPHVFERFRQQDSSSTRTHGGLGLGLAIVRHLVEMHGGTVRAESAGPGQGATFSVALPVAAVRMPPPETTSDQADMPRPQLEPDALAGLRVVVVDDEPDARELLALVLSRCGARVEAVSSAREALDALARESADVLVSDIGMPGQDGYSLIRSVRARPAGQGGHIPAVALTAYARAEDRTRALAAGFQQHAAKPIDPEELVAVVRAVAGLEGGGRFAIGPPAS